MLTVSDMTVKTYSGIALEFRAIGNGVLNPKADAWHKAADAIESAAARVAELEAELKALRQALCCPDCGGDGVGGVEPVCCGRADERGDCCGSPAPSSYQCARCEGRGWLASPVPASQDEAGDVAVQAISEHDWRALQEADALSFARGWNACLAAQVAELRAANGRFERVAWQRLDMSDGSPLPIFITLRENLSANCEYREVFAAAQQPAQQAAKEDGR